MIQFLRRLKGHSKVDSLKCMVEVIEILEHNFNADYRLNTNEWVIVTKWLEKYYCELKELYIKEIKEIKERNKESEGSKTQGLQTELSTEE